MEIIVGKTAGFCFGVQNAVTKTINELEKNKEIYCLGELVHNTQVTKELEERGAIFIEDIEEAKDKVIIRAHGVPKKIYEKANKLKIELIDLTCPKVLRTHNIATKYKNNNCFIFLVGKKDHPETIGTISYCGTNSIIIEDINGVNNAIDTYLKSKVHDAVVIAQTTYSLEKFNNIVDKLKSNIENIEVINTICSATKQRQEETIRLSKNVDLMIIIGGKHSSNTVKLYEIACKYCKKVLFVDNKDELDITEVKNIDKIGVMAGASTPKKSVKEIIDILSNLC